MPNRDTAIRHLAQADRHIREGEIRVEVMKRAIDQARALNMNVELSSASLALMIDVLDQYKEHRKLIVQTIERIDRLNISGGGNPPDPGSP